MEQEPENVIQCEFCDHSIHCKLLNPYLCNQFSITVSSSFNPEFNQLFIEPYLEELSNDLYELILP